MFGIFPFLVGRFHNPFSEQFLLTFHFLVTGKDLPGGHLSSPSVTMSMLLNRLFRKWSKSSEAGRRPDAPVITMSLFRCFMIRKLSEECHLKKEEVAFSGHLNDGSQSLGLMAQTRTWKQRLSFCEPFLRMIRLWSGVKFLRKELVVLKKADSLDSNGFYSVLLSCRGCCPWRSLQPFDAGSRRQRFLIRIQPPNTTRRQEDPVASTCALKLCFQNPPWAFDFETFLTLITAHCFSLMSTHGDVITRGKRGKFFHRKYQRQTRQTSRWNRSDAGLDDETGLPSSSSGFRKLLNTFRHKFLVHDAI